MAFSDFSMAQTKAIRQKYHAAPRESVKVRHWKARLTELGKHADFEFNFQYSLTTDKKGIVELKRLPCYQEYDRAIELASIEQSIRTWHFPSNKKYLLDFHVSNYRESSVTITENGGFVMFYPLYWKWQ